MSHTMKLKRLETRAAQNDTSYNAAGEGYRYAEGIIANCKVRVELHDDKSRRYIITETDNMISRFGNHGSALRFLNSRVPWTHR